MTETRWTIKVHLPWYPPAPAAGASSVLQLPPDDWALEPKLNGMRVIWWQGKPYARLAVCSAPAKGLSV
jgi:ATP-dependent DNA ligase